MSEPVVGFLRALATRDFDAVARCFHEDAKLRALVPSTLREDAGPEAIAARFKHWLGDLADYELVDAETEAVFDREHFRYRVEGVDPDDGPSQMEQNGYAEVEGGRITAMNLVCSGFRPLSD